MMGMRRGEKVFEGLCCQRKTKNSISKHNKGNTKLESNFLKVLFKGEKMMLIISKINVYTVISTEIEETLEIETIV